MRMKKINLYRIITIISLILSPARSSTQEESFLQSFDFLTTVAGKGGDCTSGFDGWLANFEGGPALQADLSSPHMTMADSMGNLYIADKDAHAVRKVDTKGIITTVAGINAPGDGAEDGPATAQALNSPNGVWVNKKGEFYILDLGNGKIRKVDGKGNMTTMFRDSMGISSGRGLWVSKAEDTIWYCSGSLIRIWTKSGGIVTYASGFSGSLGNIVQDPSGFLIAADRSANLVYRIDKQGNKTAIAGNGTSLGGGDGLPALETGFSGVRGVWFLPDTTYFLATHEGSQVWHIDAQGIAHLFLDGQRGDGNHWGDGENFRTPGVKVSEVRAVTVDYQGNVLVTENDCGYIRRVEKRKTAVLFKPNALENNSIDLQTNPATGLTCLALPFAGNEKINVRIFNQKGRVEKVPMTYTISVGNQEIKWQSRNLSKGVYFVSIRSGMFTTARKYVVWR
jgi:hypothetical protein